MIVNKIPFIGNGVIKPAIPEQNIEYVVLGTAPDQYVRVKNVDLTGLSGEYTFPETISGHPVKEIAFGQSSVFGSVYHIIIPFAFKGWKDWSSNYRTIFMRSPAILTINAITGYTGESGIGGTLISGDCVIFNIVSYVAQDPDGMGFKNGLQKITARKLSWNYFPLGDFTNLIVDDENYFAAFSRIEGKFGDLRVNKLRLTACTQITSDDTFRYADFEELYLDNYVGDNSKNRRFADNANLTTIYAPSLATVSSTDFSNCPNIEHIYTDSDNVQTLKDELTDKGYSGLVDLVEAI